MSTIRKSAALLAAALYLSSASAQVESEFKNYAMLDPLFESFMSENHIPGMVYGVIANGKLAYVRAFGVQDTKTRTPVTADSAFRIASMSKNFTALAALKLRDAGKLSFDAFAERYIPELAKLQYPTSDSPKITVRDLLSHTAGFVNDDPWGDRQLAMSEADFSRLISGGVPFSRAPGMAYEYSNFGFALVGRLVTNVAKQSYAEYITANFFKPLGMKDTTHDFAMVPPGRRAMGYRWEDGAWVEEPILGPGVFGAMGGVVTTARDYARFIAWEVGAWPARNDPEDAILRRASVREVARPQTYAIVIPSSNPGGCGRSASYGMGIVPYSDCVLGVHFGHSGGLPGFGSNVLMLPERGIAVFGFANRTYAPVSAVVRAAAMRLVETNSFPVRPVTASAGLQAIAAVAEKIYATGDILAAPDSLAMNMLLDRDAAHWNAQLRELKQKLGNCEAANPMRVRNGMTGNLTFPCERGTLLVTIVLAPTMRPTVQQLEFSSQ